MTPALEIMTGTSVVHTVYSSVRLVISNMSGSRLTPPENHKSGYRFTLEILVLTP